jgi:hypothetical protein
MVATSQRLNRKKMLDTPQFWLSALQLQLIRARAASEETVLWEIHCFANALRNLLRTVQQGRHEEQVRDALLQFDSEIPHAQAVRDVLEHWDEYINLQGIRQRHSDPQTSAFLVMITSGESPGVAFHLAVPFDKDNASIQVDERDLVRLDLATAARAAQQLVERTSNN